MSYTKTNWETGDVITAEKLNNLEDGASVNKVKQLTVTKSGPDWFSSFSFADLQNLVETQGIIPYIVINNGYTSGSQVVEGGSILWLVDYGYDSESSVAYALFRSARPSSSSGLYISLELTASGKTANLKYIQ